MPGAEPDDLIDEETSDEVDVRGVSVVWNAKDEGLPNVTYHGCASPFEAIGLLVVGALHMADFWAIPINDEDEEPDE